VHLVVLFVNVEGQNTFSHETTRDS